MIHAYIPIYHYLTPTLSYPNQIVVIMLIDNTNGSRNTHFEMILLVRALIHFSNSERNKNTVLAVAQLFVYSFKKMAITVMLSRTPHRGISSIAHFTTSFVADRPSRRARNAISQAARGLITSHRPSDASNTSLSIDFFVGYKRGGRDDIRQGDTDMARQKGRN